MTDIIPGELRVVDTAKVWMTTIINDDINGGVWLKKGAVFLVVGNSELQDWLGRGHKVDILANGLVGIVRSRSLHEGTTRIVDG